MKPSVFADRLAAAGRTLSEHEQRQDGPQIANSLSYGLSLLRKTLFVRIHHDVESQYGMDSTLSPVSEEKTAERCRIEIELYQIAVSTMEVTRGGYVSDPDWYCQWLSHLRFDATSNEQVLAARIADYRQLEPRHTRLRFERVLHRIMPESAKAPLVLFRVFPLAVRVVTAAAFGDLFGAQEHRNRQATLLPSILDCQSCHGRPLENGDSCPQCGNPVWSYRWLTDV